MRNLLQKPEYLVPAEILNSYIKSKGSLPRFYEENIAAYYITYGNQYSVDYLGAFAQACHETAFFKFPGGVKPEHNNFAGLGATVSGKPGDIYASIEEGVKAHILHICWYAGKTFPEHEYPDEKDGRPNRTQEVIAMGLQRNCTTFEELAKGWAADPDYWPKLKDHYKRLIDYCLPLIKDKTVSAPTWFEFNRRDNGDPWVTGYEHDTPVVELKGNSTQKLIEWLSQYTSTAQTYVVAETKKPIPPLEPPTHRTLTGKQIILDPGHSENYPGARGLAPDYPEEEDLNRLQADIIAGELSRYGADVSIVDPDNDNLWSIGQKARGADMFLSLHHNAFNHNLVDEYTCVMVHGSKAREADKQFASQCAQNIASAIKNPLFSGNAGSSYPGAYAAGLSVLSSSIATGCPVCVLTESYFVDAYGDDKLCVKRSQKAAQAIVKSVVEWFS